MPDHYDALETRDPVERERALFAGLPESVARAMTAPGWARDLKGVDPTTVPSPAALETEPKQRSWRWGSMSTLPARACA